MATKKNERKERTQELIEAGNVVGEDVKLICEENEIPVGSTTAIAFANTEKEKEIALYFPVFSQLTESDDGKLEKVEAYLSGISEDSEDGKTWVTLLCGLLDRRIKDDHANSARQELKTGETPGKRKALSMLADFAADNPDFADIQIEAALKSSESSLLGTLIQAGLVAQEQVDSYNARH